ncbi:hypothetical protein IWQ48_003788 [Labrenzia sp. EL_13]|nr:hypothetical protein [Labrenzia sp. EL_13]
MPFEHLKSADAMDRLIKQVEQSYREWRTATLEKLKRD